MPDNIFGNATNSNVGTESSSLNHLLLCTILSKIITTIFDLSEKKMEE